jgi:hypothetical protein
MKLQLKVTKSDGSAEEVTVRPVTQVALEREYKIPITEANAAEHMYWMAWHSCGSPGKYMEWLAKIDDVTPVADGDDPLAETPSSGGSLPSPSNPAQD